MKVTNISNKRIYLKDLKILHESQTEGRRGEDIYLDTQTSNIPGHPPLRQSVYLPETSEVLRSAAFGDIAHFRDGDPSANPPILPSIIVDDKVVLGAGASFVVNHNFTRQPNVVVLKQVGNTWVDATGFVDIVHDALFTQVTITNTLGVQLTFLIKVS